MATIQRVFDTLDTSSFLDGGSAASVDDSGQDSEVITLDAWEGVHCLVEVDFPGGPTDDLVIEVLSSNDAVKFDTIPLLAFTVDNASDGTISWIVTSVYSFKVNFKSSDVNDVINVLFQYRKWRWETV